MRLQAEFRHIHQEQGFLINTTVPLEFLNPPGNGSSLHVTSTLHADSLQ